MEVSAAQSQPSQASQASTSLASDFSTFLTLLTTQLQYQDPLEPLDTNEFTSQLVEFSSVEQQIAQNENLETLISLQTQATTTTAVNYIGKVATAPGDTATLVNGQASWRYDLDAPAASVELTIFDESGRTVYSGTGQTREGENIFYWDGLDAAGDPNPDGAYRLSVTALDQELEPVPVTTFFRDVISGVNLSSDDPVLSVGDRTARLNDIVKLEQAF